MSEKSSYPDEIEACDSGSNRTSQSRLYSRKQKMRITAGRLRHRLRSLGLKLTVPSYFRVHGRDRFAISWLLTETEELCQFLNVFILQLRPDHRFILFC